MKFKSLLAICSCLVLIGCTIVNSSSILLGKQRAAISFEDVNIYTAPPKNFEEIALIQAEAGHDFKSTQDVMNSAVERLKKEAAKLGANGILLNNVGRRDSNSVGVTTGTATAVGNTAFGSGVTTMFQGRGYQTISGTAIFVRD
jgi:uncharacterized protein YbjQ (UPF0145 family)